MTMSRRGNRTFARGGGYDSHSGEAVIAFLLFALLLGGIVKGCNYVQDGISPAKALPLEYKDPCPVGYRIFQEICTKVSKE